MDLKDPVPHPFVAAAARHWRRNYFLGAGVVLITTLCVCLGCNVANISREPITHFDGFHETCPPSFISYPDYQRALGFPPRLFDNLMPAKANVRRATKKLKSCFHPDKRWMNPGLDVHSASVSAILEALQDAHDKLTAWDTHPNPLSKTHWTEDCVSCTLGEEIKNTGYKFLAPYWLHPVAPESIEELEHHCPPCTIGIVQSAWATIATLRFFPYIHIEWNVTSLPPGGAHPFYWDPVFDTWNPILRSLCRWGKKGISDGYTARDLMNAPEKLKLIEEGWIGLNELSPHDRDLRHLFQKEDERRKAEEEAMFEDQAERLEKMKAMFGLSKDRREPPPSRWSWRPRFISKLFMD